MKAIFKLLTLMGLFGLLAGCEFNRPGKLLDFHHDGYQEYLASSDHYKAFMLSEWAEEDALGDYAISQRRINDFGKETPEQVIDGLFEYCERIKAPGHTCRLYALGNQRVWTLYRPSSFAPMIRAYKARLGPAKVAAIAKIFDDKRQELDLTAAIERQRSLKKTAKPKSTATTDKLKSIVKKKKRRRLDDLANQMESMQAGTDLQTARKLQTANVSNPTKGKVDGVSDSQVAIFKALYESKVAEMGAAASASTAPTADMLAWKDIGSSAVVNNFKLFLKAFETSPFAAMARAKLNDLE